MSVCPKCHIDWGTVVRTTDKLTLAEKRIKELEAEPRPANCWG